MNVIMLWIIELVRENRGKSREDRGDISDQKDQVHTTKEKISQLEIEVLTKGLMLKHSNRKISENILIE